MRHLVSMGSRCDTPHARQKVKPGKRAESSITRGRRLSADFFVLFETPMLAWIMGGLALPN